MQVYGKKLYGTLAKEEEGSKPGLKISPSRIGRVFMWWMNALIWKGFRHGLTEADLHLQEPEFESEVICSKLARLFQQKIPSTWFGSFRLILACTFQYRSSVITCSAASFIQGTTNILQAWLLSVLVGNFVGEIYLTKWEIYIYAGALCGSLIGLTFCNSYMMHTGLLLEKQMMSGFSSLIYKKTLRLSGAVLQEITSGKIVTTLSTDIETFNRSIGEMYYSCCSPFVFVAVFSMWYNQIGVTSLCGVGVVMLLLILRIWLHAKASLLRVDIAEATERRVQIMSDVISGIKVIKMFCWESSFKKLIADIRKKKKVPTATLR